MKLSDLINKQITVQDAPRFVPSQPEVITTVKRTVAPGSSKYLPKDSLRRLRNDNSHDDTFQREYMTEPFEA